MVTNTIPHKGRYGTLDNFHSEVQKNQIESSNAAYGRKLTLGVSRNSNSIFTQSLQIAQNRISTRDPDNIYNADVYETFKNAIDKSEGIIGNGFKGTDQYDKAYLNFDHPNAYIQKEPVSKSEQTIANNTVIDNDGKITYNMYPNIQSPSISEPGSNSVEEDNMAKIEPSSAWGASVAQSRQDKDTFLGNGKNNSLGQFFKNSY